MFGHAYFGAGYFGPAYWGPFAAPVVHVVVVLPRPGPDYWDTEETEFVDGPILPTEEASVDIDFDFDLEFGTRGTMASALFSSVPMSAATLPRPRDAIDADDEDVLAII